MSVNVDAELWRIEDSLWSLREGFGQYRLQLARAYECAQALLARRERGFSSAEQAALYDEALDYAVQAYFQLRDRINWWLEQACQIIAALIEIEREVALMDASMSEFNRKRAQTREFEDEPCMPFIDLEGIF